MKCGIVNCTQNDNRFLWRCHGTCKRAYHAACIGVQRNHEEVLSTFMLPLCHDCQEQFLTELDLKHLSVSLRGMTENIGHTLAANHQLQANIKSLSSTHDNILEQIETMFKEIKQNISSVSSSNKKCATDLKTTMGALFDTSSADSSMAIEKAAKLAATAAVETIITTTTTTATTAAASIAELIDCSLPKLINELRDDLVDANSTLAFTVKAQMEEMAKALSAPKPCSSDPIAMNNLETELLNCEPVPSWRMLGSKRIWKRD